MASNLDYAHYEPFFSIAREDVEHSKELAHFYCWAGSMNADMGRNFVSLEREGSRGTCPFGWHLPSDEEWAGVIDFAKGQEIELNSQNPPLEVYKGGFRSCEGCFMGSSAAYFWTSTQDREPDQAIAYQFTADGRSANRIAFTKHSGANVRCVKNSSERQISTQIEDLEFVQEGSFEVYPNPVQDDLYVKLEPALQGNVEVSLVTLTGRTLLRQYQNSDHPTSLVRFNVESLNNGLYLVIVRKDNFSEARKVNKQ